MYKNFLKILLLIPIFALGLNLRAQTPAAGELDLGGNPFETPEELTDTNGDGVIDENDKTEEDENAKDSTKVKKPVKPLESYYFTDSIRARQLFKWNLNPGSNRITLQKIDTLLEDWRIDYPFQKEGVGSMYLGGLGQASQPIDYTKRANYQDFEFAQVFDDYIYTPENAPFYNVKSPFTQMNYLEAGQTNYREANFGLTHAQNLSPSTGFALDYQSRSTKGQYDNQSTKNHNLAFTIAHTGKRYSAQGGYINNMIDNEESGGVVGIWTVRDSIFELPIGIPMKLGTSQANNHYRNSVVFLQQTYGVPLESLDEEDFSMANKTAFYLGHYVELNTWSKTYADVRSSYTNDRAEISDTGEWLSRTDEYYKDWFIDPTQTRDSIRERRLTNKLFIQTQPWGRNAFVANIDGGIAFDMYSYKQFELNNYLSGELKETKETAWYVYGEARGELGRTLSWKADAKLYPTGYREGDYRLGGDLLMSAYIRNKEFSLSAKASMEQRSPSFWQENLFSNHFVFQNPLGKESETRLEARFLVPGFNFELSASQVLIDNLIYYDTQANVAQASGVTSLTSFYLRKKFQLGNLNLDHRLLAQISSDEAIAPVPDLSAYLSYYLEFWAVRDVLRLQIGADSRYTTAYNMPDYNPAISNFFNQSTENIGAYPYTDLFVAAKWKRMRILLKYQHINQGLFGNGEYFTVNGYPLNPGMFRIGISWGFYD